MPTRRPLIALLLALALLAFPPAAPVSAAPAPAVSGFTSPLVTGDPSAVRLADPDLREAILGALVTLDDNQVRDRSGRRLSVFDASDAGDGCRGRVEMNLPFLQRALRLPALPPITVRNVEGEWTSTVHFLPKKFGKGGKSLVAIPDSNLFVPAFVCYPLFLFREATPAGDRPIAGMLKAAWDLSGRYRRGAAYNFWLPMRENPTLVGPFNIPLEKAILPLARAYLNPRLAFFWRKLAGKLNVPSPEWVARCLDPVENPGGGGALFNIPNDADDTATAVAIQAARAQLAGAYPDDPFFAAPARFAVDLAALEPVYRYRDTGREPALEDGRDAWKGRNSGAYLTWLTDERAPTFGSPATGVIPLGKNNVDAVVNANVLLALGLAGRRDAPGYAAACALVNKACVTRAWPACGLYYPPLLIFPYAATRAYRDGGNPALRPGMKALLADLLALRDDYAAKFPAKRGAFPGGEDRIDLCPTALGVTALLNIGGDVAREIGREADYRLAIDEGVRYLLAARRETGRSNPETFAVAGRGRDLRSVRWESGLFFAASFWDLAHWRSEPFAVAMTLEAFAKYALAYEAGSVAIASGRRLVIGRYPDAWGRGVPGFDLAVK